MHLGHHTVLLSGAAVSTVWHYQRPKASLMPIRSPLQVILSIPEDMAVTCLDAEKQELIGSIASEQGCGELVALTLWLIAERAKGTASPYAALIATLPVCAHGRKAQSAAALNPGSLCSACMLCRPSIFSFPVTCKSAQRSHPPWLPCRHCLGTHPQPSAVA